MKLNGLVSPSEKSIRWTAQCWTVSHRMEEQFPTKSENWFPEESDQKELLGFSPILDIEIFSTSPQFKEGLHLIEVVIFGVSNTKARLKSKTNFYMASGFP